VSAPRIAGRYAEALFSLARDRDAVSEIRSELSDLSAAVEASPDLQQLLTRPDLPVERKLAALEAALGDRLSRDIVSLLGVIVTHRRGDAVSGVAEAYGELADRAAGIVRAEVETVVPLAPGQRSRLLAAIQRLTGAPVKLEERIDPGVIAGVRLRIGDSLVDGSAAGRLARLRDELVNQRG